MQELIITRPDDWHVHWRDGPLLQHTVSATAQHFSRALVMPNLKTPLNSLERLIDYRKRLLIALGTKQFTPYLSFYLNEAVNPADLQEARKHPFILGAKLYPAGATTNSEEGARSLKAIYPLFELLQQQDLVLQIHGEMAEGDIFEREAHFIENFLLSLTKDFPKLRMVLEHISTKKAVEFVQQASNRVAATITPHHLLYNRNQLLAGGIRPHYYCLPILKKRADQLALQKAAISANPKFFGGTDSAPHPQSAKESSCGCAGIYSAPYAVTLYAQFFDSVNQLDKLDAFLGHFGAQFYQLPLNQNQLRLNKNPQWIPNRLPLGEDQVVPIAAGEQLDWSVADCD